MDDELEELKKILVIEKLQKEYQKSLNSIRQKIIDITTSTASIRELEITKQNFVPEIQTVLRELQETNWPDLFQNRQMGDPLTVEMMAESIQRCDKCAQYRLSYEITYREEKKYCGSCLQTFLQEERLQYMNQQVECKECKNTYFRYQIKEEVKIGDFRSISGYCTQCLEIILPLYYRSCALCDKQYTALAYNERFDLCHECRTPKLIKEGIRVHEQKQRALLEGLEATLTLKEWLKTLDYFEWKCSYCSKKFDCMEHYIPLPLKGTTADNCLPSCTSCNLKKSNRQPELFRQNIKPHHLQKIDMYLSLI